MLEKVDLNNSKNLFIVSGILVIGIGGLTLNFGYNSITDAPILTVSALAVALLFGILTNLIVNDGKIVADSSESDSKK